jgi:hypothetical protein
MIWKAVKASYIMAKKSGCHCLDTIDQARSGSHYNRISVYGPNLRILGQGSDARLGDN